MSQYNKNDNLSNYLVKDSLFKRSQRSKLVSPYVSHLNYFEREDNNQILSRSPRNYVRTRTPKKEYALPFRNSISPYESRNDILKPTSKKQLLQPRQDSQKKLVSFVRSENQNNYGIKKSQIAQQKQINVLNEYQRDPNREINSLKHNSSIVNPRQSKIQMKQYSSQQIFNAFDEANDEQNREKIPSKLNSELIQLQQKQLASRKQNIGNSMFIVKEQNTIKSSSLGKDSYNKLNNPYNQNYQFQTKQGQSRMKKTDSNNFDVPPSNVKNVKNVEIQVIEVPQQTNYNVKYPSPRKNSDVNVYENNSYILNNIRNNTGQYMFNVNQRLKKCYQCLESLESEIDILLENNLEQQCSNLKKSLFRMIQIEIEQFRERERHLLYKTKFYFMADLYEIKCNIDLRLQQIDDYNHLLTHQYKWKNVIGNIMTPNYEESIKCIEQKTDQISKECNIKTNHQLTLFKRYFHENIALNMQDQIKKISHDILERFRDLQYGKKRNQIESMYYRKVNNQDERIYQH